MTTRPLELLSGRYRLGARLGQGGMAEVFAADDLRLGRSVAVKMLRPQLSADETVRWRFEQEARTAARLSHPNVVGIIDTGEDDELAFIIMERLDGTTIADELRAGPLTEDRVRDVARQVLSALQAAHDAGIVHRDIKPANILTCADGRVKVADFGIATAMDEAQTITGTGLLIGTPAYVAPERLAGASPSPAADLYSLAAVLYECLTGRKPFEGATALELVASVRDRHPQPIAELRPDADPLLAALVEQTLVKNPADRPPSARAMARLLEEAHAEPAAPTATIRIAAPGTDRTEVLALPAQTASAVWRSARWAAARESLGRYKVVLVFLGALLLSLVIALPLAATGAPSPAAPSAPAAGHASSRSPSHTTGHTTSHTTGHTTVQPISTKGLPAPLARSLKSLESAVR